MFGSKWNSVVFTNYQFLKAELSSIVVNKITQEKCEVICLWSSSSN